MKDQSKKKKKKAFKREEKASPELWTRSERRNQKRGEREVKRSWRGSAFPSPSSAYLIAPSPPSLLFSYLDKFQLALT